VKVFFPTKRLAFGSMITTWSDVEQLQALGITHVINLMRNTNNKKTESLSGSGFRLRTTRSLALAGSIEKLSSFNKRARQDRDRKVFVMCHHGISRSASMAYFLLRASGLGSDKAEATIRRVRPCAKIVRAYRESSEQYLLRKRFCLVGPRFR